jgi:Ca2+-binding EF-hand superfamily protein
MEFKTYNEFLKWFKQSSNHRITVDSLEEMHTIQKIFNCTYPLHMYMSASGNIYWTTVRKSETITFDQFIQLYNQKHNNPDNIVIDCFF